MKVSEDKLNDVMGFDHVIQVHADGTVSEPGNVWAPEVWDQEGDSTTYVSGPGWSLMHGYSGQFGYSGPVMADCESIRGPLARAILETPGLYASVAVPWIANDARDDGGSGWAVAFKEAA